MLGEKKLFSIQFDCNISLITPEGIVRQGQSRLLAWHLLYYLNESIVVINEKSFNFKSDFAKSSYDFERFVSKLSQNPTCDGSFYWLNICDKNLALRFLRLCLVSSSRTYEYGHLRGS